MASARYPSSRNASRATLSRRFDSFCRFSFTTTGTCAQIGGVCPSASQSSCCLGVLGRCSSARITCVIFMVTSSTTLASRKTAEPSLAHDDEVLEQGVVEGGLPADEVNHASLTLVVECGIGALASRPDPVRGRGRTRRTRARSPIGAQRHVLAGALAVVRLARGVELRRRCGVRLGIAGLEVRALVRPSLNSDPVQRRQDSLGPFRAVPGRVSVLDAQHERPAVLPGEDPVLQGGAGSTDVEQASGRGCESHAYRHALQRRATGPDRRKQVCPVAKAAYHRELRYLLASTRQTRVGCRRHQLMWSRSQGLLERSTVANVRGLLA